MVCDRSASSAKIELRHQYQSEHGGLMSEITTVGVDLAKDVIVVCAGD